MSYGLTFFAHVGAWMDLRVVGPATRRSYPTHHAAEIAAERILAAAMAACQNHADAVP